LLRICISVRWRSFLLSLLFSLLIFWEYCIIFYGGTCSVTTKLSVRQCIQRSMQSLTSQWEAMDFQCAPT
jgi:hypothetical protein